ncbi:MAG: hypothetical protein ABJZ55_01895 [Fuerstiella sp.]
MLFSTEQLDRTVKRIEDLKNVGYLTWGDTEKICEAIAAAWTLVDGNSICQTFATMRLPTKGVTAALEALYEKGVLEFKDATVQAAANKLLITVYPIRIPRAIEDDVHARINNALAPRSIPNKEPELHSVSQTLSDHIQGYPECLSKELLEAAHFCLQARKFRPAIVMGWCFTVHRLIDLLDKQPNHLRQFNTEFVKEWKVKREGIKQSAIGSRGELKQLKESHLISVMKKAEILNHDQHSQLELSLRTRNKAAHPDDEFEMGPTSAAGYLETLLLMVTALNIPP